MKEAHAAVFTRFQMHMFNLLYSVLFLFFFKNKELKKQYIK